MSDTTDMKFRRRDMLDAEKVAGVSFGKLFEDGVPTALGSLAIQYVMEKRNDLTDLDWDTWLDEEPDGIEVEVDDPS